jgi:hypothetical protein
MEPNNLSIETIFQKQIKIEPKVMAIQTMFNNPRRLEKTNYKPPYQRNYVWDNEKATYFIESIILGTEIPPLIFFKSGENIEVIDGRQRYETVFNFVKDNSKQKLIQKGLLILTDLKNKKFDNLDTEIRNAFWDTKLRLIEFSFISDPENKEIEEVVKREIFKRYNSGITPLKTTEVDKAKFLENDVNSFFKEKLQGDKRLYDLIKTLFPYDVTNIEVLLKEIRKILVIDSIPINYYSTKKDFILNKFFEFYFEREDIDVEEIYFNFIKKVNFLYEIYNSIDRKHSNRLVFECLFWAITILEKEGNDLDTLIKTILKREKEDLIKYIALNISSYSTERNSFAPQIMKRYQTTANYFSDRFNIDFSDYLRNNERFKERNISINKKEKTDKTTLEKFDSLRLNKPDASSITIDDICRQMENNRFLIRPAYQRDEVINKVKSSAIIESIILGIKLPPIFIFKKQDGVSEVIDGQQRLLSIIGFIGKKYVNEKGKLTESKKHKFSLNLKNGILKDLDRNTFDSLPAKIRNKILDFDLWVIEINEKNNPHFEPIDLYLRLNSKPFPIKENTFEMWNSYISRDIIDGIKHLNKEEEAWFYLRKNNNRMDNEDLITSLIYLFFKAKNCYQDFDKIVAFLDMYVSGGRIAFRIKSKSDITKTLEDSKNSDELISQIKDFGKSFTSIVKALVSNSGNLSTGLDKLIGAETTRTSKSFYILWLLIANVSPEKLYSLKDNARKEITLLIKGTNRADSKDKFKSAVIGFWKKYS